MEDGGGFGAGASFEKAPKGRRWGEVVKPMDYNTWVVAIKKN